MEGTLNQPYVALVNVYVGMALGALHFLLGRLLRVFGRSAAARHIADALFSVLLAGTVVVVFYHVSNFSFRLFYFAGMALGFGLYAAGIHPLVCRVLSLFSGPGKKRKKKSP